MTSLSRPGADLAERKKIIILGGTGFVGRNLATALYTSVRSPLVYLVHRRQPEWLSGVPVEVFRASLDDPDQLHELFSDGKLLINMLRPDGTEWCLNVLRRTLPVAISAGVNRIIHLSSIDVYGRAESSMLDEKSETFPNNDYAKEHLKLEQLVLENVPHAIVLRLGAIFGDGGRNVVSFAKEVQTAPYWLLSARRMVYGRRRMHLVSLDAVCSIVCQLVERADIRKKTVVLVTDDDDERNNFVFIQEELMKAFGRSSLHAVPLLPISALEFVLGVRGRERHLPRRRFSSETLRNMRLHRPDFGRALRSYVTLLSQALK